MKLSGRDLRVVPGVITVYLHVPLDFGSSASLSHEDEAIFGLLGERLRVEREQAYQRAQTESGADRAEIIRNRLAVTVETNFSPRERALLIEALDACAAEMERGGDVNIHFNGNEYGIQPEHLRNLQARLAEAA